MTFISRKTRLLVPRWPDESDPEYLYKINRKRSDGRLKRHSSCDDLRAWADDEYLNYQHLLELTTNGWDRPFLGIMGRFIPVVDIMEMLCGDVRAAAEDPGWRVAGMEAKPTSHELTADDVIKVTNAAMEKLENINHIVRSVSGYELANTVSSRVVDTEEDESAKSVNNEECGRVLQKIACLQQKLDSIHQCREQMAAKAPDPASRTSVRELFSREGRAREKRTQELDKKFIKENGKVLKEMCQTVKHLYELGRKFDRVSSDSVSAWSSSNQECPCSCPRSHEGKGSFLTDTCKSCFSDELSTANSSGHEQKGRPNCRKRDANGANSNSSRRTVASAGSANRSDNSCGTYRVSRMNEPIPNGKFKSRTTMTEVEQALRSYEQRLKELETLEEQIVALRKNASLANYFKKRWLRCSARGRSQNTAEREKMVREVNKLCAENKNLKCVIRNFKHEEERAKMQLLLKMADREMETEELKKKLRDYESSYESQRQSIAWLERTVTVQRQEIEKLISQMKLRSDAEKSTDRRQKKEFIRSRSYGPESKWGRGTSTSSEDEIQRGCCPSCSVCNDQRGRPRSECNRRCANNDSSVCQQTCRRQNCCN